MTFVDPSLGSGRDFYGDATRRGFDALARKIHYAVVDTTGDIRAPWAGLKVYERNTKLEKIYSGTVWITVTPQSANVDTQQTTASTSYADLATVGPSVTVLTGTSALVTVSCQCFSDTNNGYNFMSWAVSGATTSAAADNRNAEAGMTVALNVTTSSKTTLFTGLTAGSNVFTAKYKVLAGTGSWVYRNITVQAIPS